MASWSQAERTLRSTLWRQPVSAVTAPWGRLLPMFAHQACHQALHSTFTKRNAEGTGGHMNKPWLGPVWNLSLEEGAQMMDGWV